MANPALCAADAVAYTSDQRDLTSQSICHFRSPISGKFRRAFGMESPSVKANNVARIRIMTQTYPLAMQ